jgi:hypothetical protein
VEADEAVCEDGLFLDVCSCFYLYVFLYFLHGLAGSELLYESFQRSQFFGCAYFAYDHGVVLGFAGVPSDDDEFLGEPSTT